MGFDIRTLFVADVTVLLTTAGVSFYLWRQNRDIAGLLWWSLATATEGASLLVLGVFGPAPPVAVGIPTAVCFVAGFLMVWESMRRFNGRPAAVGRLAFLTFAFAVVFVVAMVMGADLRQRASLIMFAMALCAALSAWEVTFGGAAQVRSRFFLTAIFSVIGVLLAWRAIVAGLVRPEQSDMSFAGLLGDAPPLISFFGIISLCLGLVMMAGERASNRYRRLALTDDLTGLPNRRFLLDRGSRHTRQAENRSSDACVMMMDLDHFANINRRFGHAGGDQALIAFSALLQQHMRQTDIVARYGGEEFCMLLTSTDIKEAARRAELLRATVAGHNFTLTGQPVEITVSIGIAPLRYDDLVGSIRDADAALYRAKARGRNRVVVGESAQSEPAGVKRAEFRIVR